MLFTQHWPQSQLGAVAEVDRAVVAPDRIPNGSHYVGLEHIAGDGTLVGVDTVDVGELRSAKFAFSERHVLFGKLRPYLRKVARPTFSGVCSTDILPILPGPNLDRDFLFHALRQPRIVSLATSRSEGANLPRISPNALLDFPISLPPVAEQRRIAAVLDQGDTIRRKRWESLKLLDEFLRSAFLEMFGDPVKNENGWPTFKLDKLIESGPQNGLYRPATDYGSGAPIVRINSFYDGEITDLRLLLRVRASPDEIVKYGLREGDVLVNRVNSREFLGKSALVPELHEATVFESNMMRFRVLPDRIEPGYLVALLQTPYLKRQVANRTRDAVNQASFNQDDLRSFDVRIPPMTLQRSYLTLRSRWASVRQHCLDGEAVISSLFDSLAQRAFRGELDVVGEQLSS